MQSSATLARQAALVFAKQTEGSLASQSRRRMQPGGGCSRGAERRKACPVRAQHTGTKRALVPKSS
ncbi:hypothetical protein [Paenibacillus odorifer]|uniref:hypothetical protein n=1 Tax=Paenibacillus odorifer TaxID=189426 RepID=UPI0015C37AAD|nr:hypothetical protein [Paenibacillus odorifer]